MLPRLLPTGLLVLLFTFGLLAAPLAASASRPLIVATTSMLGCAVNAVGGAEVEVETLLPPGSCPSSFDLAPGKTERLLKCSFVVRHDFQSFLDARLLANGIGGEQLLSISLAGGLCMPSSFVEACTLIAERLAKAQPEKAELFRSRSRALALHANKFGVDLHTRAARLKGKPVAVALHQVAFVSWLGLNVAVQMAPGEEPSPSFLSKTLAQCKVAQVLVVVGNIPSGHKLPETLAASARVPVVMLNNFPPSNAAEDYWRMIEENTTALLKAIP